MYCIDIYKKSSNEKFTSSEIISTLKDMNFMENIGNEYVLTYTRTDLTDALHEKFGFRTDYHLLTSNSFKKILKKLEIKKHSSINNKIKIFISIMSIPK